MSSQPLPSNVDQMRQTVEQAPVDEVTMDYDSGCGEAVFDVLTQDVEALEAYLDDTNLRIDQNRWVVFGHQVSISKDTTA
jgi:hypothetical protein